MPVPYFIRSIHQCQPNALPAYPCADGFEAPAMFKRKGLYYTLTSSACCYCGGGGTVYVHSSDNPLGPYTSQVVRCR